MNIFYIKTIKRFVNRLHPDYNSILLIVIRLIYSFILYLIFGMKFYFYDLLLYIIINAVITFKDNNNYSNGNVNNNFGQTIKNFFEGYVIPEETGISKLHCPECNAIIEENDIYCSECGKMIDKSKVITIKEDFVSPSNFDEIYLLSDDEMIKTVIDEELKKCNFKNDKSLVSPEILNRLKVLNIIYSILLFACIASVFFHLQLYIYIIEIVLLLIFFILKSKYDLMNFIFKSVKERPDEKISNIVSSIVASLVKIDKKNMYMLIWLQLFYL